MGRGFGVGLAGGVVGGAVVALLIAFWFQGGDEVEALRARVDQIDSTLADATAGGELETLAGRIQALETSSGGDLVSRLDALEAQAQGQGATEARLEALESGASTPDLAGRMAEIETALSQLPSSGDSQLTQLEERIAALESGTAASAAAPASDEQAVQALQERLAAVATETAKLQDVESRLSQLDQRLSASEQAASEVEQLSGSVDQLSQKLGADAQQSQALASQLSALGERVSGAESKIESADRDRNRAAALALIVGQLEAAIEDARPYQTQVQTLTSMTGDAATGDEAIKQAVSDLEPGATTGVPSLATLRQSFEPVANEIVHAARAPDGDNLLDRATDNLMRMVTVRPVGGDVRGDSVEARVARAESALAQGDLAAAVAELDQLDGRPAAAAADWLKQAKARLGADQAVAQLRTQATDLLTQSN
jgi:hypothetical protein